MTLPLRHGAFAVLLAATFVPFAAEADIESNRIYASVSGLYLVPKDSRSFGEDAVFSADGSVIGDTKYTIGVDMDGGFGLLAAFGYGPEIGLRAESEIGFRKSVWVTDAKSHHSSTLTQTQIQAENAGLSGNTKSLSLMANGIYTFDAGRLRPYVGVGLGIARHDVTLEAQSIEITITQTSGDEEESGSSTFEIERTSRDDTVLAMQAMFGVSFPMSERLEARLGYRYFRTRDTDDSDVSYSTRNVEAGLLFRF